MSSAKKRRNVSNGVYKKTVVPVRKKIKKETDTSCNEVTVTKQPIILPNGRIFYPCQFCNKIFPQKASRTAHTKKCPNSDIIRSILNDESENSENTQPTHLSNSKISISQNVQVVAKQNESQNVYDDDSDSSNDGIRIVEICTKNPTNNTPIISIKTNLEFDSDSSSDDYDDSSSVEEVNREHNPLKTDSEQDTCDGGDETSINSVRASKTDSQYDNVPSVYDFESDVKDEEYVNNRKCKFCDIVLESPLELLRHKRNCHSFPRTILPPEEIEKYFDSPDRSFCPICLKPIRTYNFRSVFIKHLLVHTTGLTHECAVCKKKFRRRDHMKAHEKRHIVPV